MVSQVAQHRGTLVITGVGIALPEYDLRAWLVKFGAKYKLSRLAVQLAALLAANRPSGNDFGITRDIGLRVAASDTQGVELERLACEVLVDTAFALGVLPGAVPRRLGIRAYRNVV